MHEAGLIAAAIGEALDARPAGAAERPRAIALTIVDPVHVSEDSARLHLEVALRARRMHGVPVRVEARTVACEECRTVNAPMPSHPFCDACGWPLPHADGPAVVIAATW